MVYVYIFIVVISLVLAILSRKHFSKYKDVRGLKRLAFSLGQVIYKLLYGFLPVDKVRDRIRNTKVLSEEKLNKAVDMFFVRALAGGYLVLMLFTGLSFAAFLQASGDDSSDNTVKRQSYGGVTSHQDFILSNGENEYKYRIGISPKEYSEDEFLKKAEHVFDWLATEILGENEELSHIRKNLNLVTQDKEGIFEISWQTDNPDCISATGLLREGYEESRVRLTASIEYMDYTASHVYEVQTDCTLSEEERLFGDAIAALKGIEAESRTKEAVMFPDTVGNVDIELYKEETDLALLLFLVGVIFSGLMIAKFLSDLKQKKNKRDNMLILDYSKLVNHLWLFIGAGMTFRSALSLFVRNGGSEGVLTGEILYTLNLIESGADEVTAYEELGRRLDIPEYNRLFAHIGQNLRMGTKDIRNIMEDELLQSVIMRREYSRKKGEEASMRLVFPMIIMLCVVMLIVMVPALVGYV